MAEAIYDYKVTVFDASGNVHECFHIDGLDDQHAYEEATYEAKSDYGQPGWRMVVERGERMPYDNTLG